MVVAVAGVRKRPEFGRIRAGRVRDRLALGLLRAQCGSQRYRGQSGTLQKGSAARRLKIHDAHVKNSLAPLVDASQQKL